MPAFPIPRSTSRERTPDHGTSIHTRTGGGAGAGTTPARGAAKRGAYAPGGHRGRRWGEPRLGSVNEERRIAAASRRDDVDLSDPKVAPAPWGAKPPPPPEGGGAARGRQTPRRRRSRRRRMTSEGAATAARRQADRPGRSAAPQGASTRCLRCPRVGVRTKVHFRDGVITNSQIVELRT